MTESWNIASEVEANETATIAEIEGDAAVAPAEEAPALDATEPADGELEELDFGKGTLVFSIARCYFSTLLFN
jgi:hypothetical protein